MLYIHESNDQVPQFIILEFVSDQGRPYHLTPAYDMTSMVFAPSNSGKLPSTVPAAQLHVSVRDDHWRVALSMDNSYLAALRASAQFSASFEVCVNALAAHIEKASAQIAQLA